jgi:hypothetical protein
VALVVDPVYAAAGHTALQHSTQGMLAVAVADRSDALRLLNHLAFELVAEIQLALGRPGDEDGCGALRVAARNANCGPFLVLHATEPSPRPAVSSSGRLRLPHSLPAVAAR